MTPLNNRLPGRDAPASHGDSNHRDPPFQLDHRTRRRLGATNSGPSEREHGFSSFYLAWRRGFPGSAIFGPLQLGAISKVAPIDKLSVVVAMALAITFLGEKLNLREGIGAGLIVLRPIVLAWK